MRCMQAREIIHLCMDGQEHKLSTEASRHIKECNDCRAWKAEVEAISEMLVAVRDEPDVNLSAAIMGRLPEKHPASCRTSVRSFPKINWMYVGAGWLMGGVVMCLVFIALHSAGFLSMNNLSYEFVGIGRSAMAILSVLSEAAYGIFKSLYVITRHNGSIREGIRAFLLVDSLLWICCAMIWRLRLRIGAKAGIMC